MKLRDIKSLMEKGTKMNQHQKKYALHRIEGLRSIKLREAEEKCTSKEVKISDEEKYKLIASGKVKVKSWAEVKQRYSEPDLLPSFDFSKYEEKPLLNELKFNPIKDLILKTSQEAQDQIMLGDCAEALRLITELEKIKV